MYNQPQLPSLNPLSIKNITVPADQKRRKRLKVLSACNECRRKKTKCNGEKPCTGCLKANVECKYSNNNPKLANNAAQHRTLSRPITPRKTTYLPPVAVSIPSSPQPKQMISEQQHVTQQSSIDDVNKSLWTTVQSIEGRLSSIENILQLLLQQQHSTEEGRYTNQLPSVNEHHRASVENGQKKRTLNNYSSDSSSVCSSIASPKITAIPSLLNDEKSTYYKPTIVQNNYYI